MNIAETLRNARNKVKLTRQQLSQHYDIPLRTLESWEDAERTPPAYVVTLLLRCLEVDFKAPQSLSETEEIVAKSVEPVHKKVDYIFCNSSGKPLPTKLAELVRAEYEKGRVQLQEEIEEDLRGEMVPVQCRGRLYLCTEPINGEFGVEFRAIPFMEEV